MFGDPRQTGKPAGDDLREGKRTFLVAAALETTDATGRALLAKRLGDPGLDPDGIDQLREIIASSGALARTEERITALTDTALAALDRAELAAEAREVLIDLAIVATRRSL